MLITATANVSIFDGKTYSILGTVKTGTIPYAMAVDTASNQVYVTNLSGDNATVIYPSGRQ